MAPYSLDLRQRVVRACESGLTPAAVAARFDVSVAWVYRLVQRRRETGSIAPRKQTKFRGRGAVGGRGRAVGGAHYGATGYHPGGAAARAADPRGAEHTVAGD